MSRPLSLQSSTTRQRLPTLAEVLARRTAPPVDLYCYYLFLQREGSEDSLDFWLDVQQHENLCRAYFKDLRRSGRSVRDDWPAYYDEARERGSIYNRINGIDNNEKAAADPIDEKHSSEMDRIVRSQPNHPDEATAVEEQPASADSPSPHPRFPGDPDPAGPTPSRAERRSLLAKRASHAPTVISRSAAITRVDLIASAERIYARYLLPGSEKEIYLPSQFRILSFPISSNSLPHPNDYEQQRALARVPDMFHAQKE